MQCTVCQIFLYKNDHHTQLNKIKLIMGVDTSTQPLTIYNMVSSLLTIKIFLD